MRVIFYGSGEFGLPTLRRLVASHEVALVVSQPDRPAGRNRRPQPTPVGRWAEQQGLKVIKPTDVNGPQPMAALEAARPEAQVVVAFGQKIGSQLIGLPQLGPSATMNLHASLLPKYRGAAPIQWAICRGETETGNTVFCLTDRMDAGDILGSAITQIDPLETAGELHDRLAEAGGPLVLRVLEDFAEGRVRPVRQDESAVTLAPKLSRENAVLDLSADAEAVRCHVHGLTPWPGVRAWWRPKENGPACPLLWRRVTSERHTETVGEPGRYLGEGRVCVGRGVVRLLEVQEPGKKKMAFDQFDRGRSLPAGGRFLPQEPL